MESRAPVRPRQDRQVASRTRSTPDDPAAARGSAAAQPPAVGEPEAVGAERSKLGALWRWGQHGWPARFPVAQFPNAPLLVALIGSFASSLTDGVAHPYARGAFYAGLSVWAWGEMSSGVNWFRRVLGVGGLAYVFLELGAALAARS